MIHDLKPYPAYKDSDVPWLGEVPEHWIKLRIKNLFREKDERNGNGNGFLLSLTRTRGIIPQTEASNRIASAEDLSKYKVCYPGDLIMNRMQAWSGMFAVSSYNGLVSPDYSVFTTLGKLNIKYFEHLFKTPVLVDQFAQRSKGIGSGFNRLYTPDFGAVPLVIPSLPEQSAIVRYLDHIDRRIWRYIRSKQKLIKLLEEQKQAIIHQAVTRGLDPDVELKPSGIEWLGEIPENWGVRRAKQLCIDIIDCKNRTPDIIPEGEYTVVRTTCIRNGEFNLLGSYKTDKHNYDIWTQRGAPQFGDVFFTREAPAGEACLVPNRQDLCMGQRMMYFRPDPELLDPRFLLFSVYGPIVRTYIEHECSGSTVGHLRLGQVYGLPLLWCPLEEQKKIVAHIEGFSTDIDKIISQANREISLLREYRTRLIADVVTGKLDVREAAKNLPEEKEDMIVVEDFEEETTEEQLVEVINDDID